MRYLILILALAPGLALAHEGHAPLPTKGATVSGNRLMLSPSASKAIGVQTAQVELAEVRSTIRCVGNLELPWSQQAYVSTLIAGRIESVLVGPGEAVSAGQELARVSGMELELLQLTLLEAHKEMSLAKRLMERQEAAGDGIAAKVLLETRTDAQQQSARFKIAWEKLAAIGLDDVALQKVCDTGETVSSISIRSPISGIVSVAEARAGQIAEPTEHLYHIVDPSRLWVVAKVLEADAGSVKVGMPVEVSLAALPDQVLKTAVDHIELRLNKDRTLSVKALLVNPGMLRPGMFARVQIELASGKAVVCPGDAIAGGFALVQQTAGNFVRKPVAVAAMRGQQAEITDGLFPGDKVVTVGSHELAALFAETAAQVTLQVQPDRLISQGEIELPTDQKTFASAPIEGRVRRILVEHGQPVRKGDLLAELDSLPFKNLQLDLRHASSSLNEAELNLSRVRTLGDSIARMEHWKQETDRDKLRHMVSSLENQLLIVGADEQEPVVPIRAPADGVICDFSLIPGQVVGRHDQLFEIHNLAKVWARAYLFEQEATRVHTGQSAQVRLVSAPQFMATARIERLDPMLLAGNRALAVWLELDNSDWQLKEGMAATVMLED